MNALRLTSLCAVLAAALPAMAATAPDPSTTSAAQHQARVAPRTIEQAFRFAEQQLERTVAGIPATAFPVYSDNRTAEATYGQWLTRALTNPRSPDWRVGFFPGALWLMYEHTRDPKWRTRAEAWTHQLEGVQNDTSSHDVGFEMLPSYGNALRLTRNPAYTPILLRSAQSLATRYNPVVGATQSWSWAIPQRWTFPVIVDNMLNLELLFWSAAHGGDPRHYDMALSHALKTRENHIRPDGGSYHVVDYDPATGQVIKQITFQGYANDSTWARGQAWAIYGFTMSYRYTRDPRMLETAEKTADYYIEHVRTGDWVPNWDFQAPQQYTQKDSSAAAIAASGLIELADFELRRHRPLLYLKYRNAAGRMLEALSASYLSKNSPNWGILQHGAGNYPASYNNNDSREIDVALIYGDYYFLEALLRYRNLLRQNQP